jgi:hypothetical protein
LRRQIFALDVRQLDTRRARIAFLLITSSCMTAWRWRAFLLLRHHRSDSFSTAPPISFRGLVYAGRNCALFPFLFCAGLNPTIRYIGCLLVRALYRDMLGILHWIISGEAAPSTCVYIRLPGMC